jgi:hypothetical protein
MYISGEAMMQATDDELMAECHAMLGTAPAAHGSPATAASPSWVARPEAMQVEEDGSEEPAAVAAAPPAPAAPAAPAAPPVAPEPAPAAPPAPYVSRFAGLLDD